METEIYWKAVQNNDTKFNGAFVYGVSSTRIYCKPSCSSKLPKRENVHFFDSTQIAENKGFRACLRCKPKSETVSPQTEIVLRTCEMLEKSEQISLEDLEVAVRNSLDEWQKENKIARIWAKDASVWTNTDEAKWLGWLDVVEKESNDLQKYRDFAEDAKNFKDIVLLGMGGSSLCPEVFAITFGARNFYVLD